MEQFYGTPVFLTGAGDDAPSLVVFTEDRSASGALVDALSRNQIVVIRPITFEAAGAVFADLADHFGVRDSYDVQMQHVVSMMAARDAVENVAVTVNKRGAYQLVQPHSEGDTTAPLELFALYCVQNAAAGGESVLSLVNQDADHSTLRAKEKAILDRGLSRTELNVLRRHHLDARTVIAGGEPFCRVLAAGAHGDVVVRYAPLARSRSVVSGGNVVTYWDNVTVHDRAFHRFNHALLRDLGLLRSQDGADDYSAYLHVEDDSPWAPADTDSGGLEQTSRLFRCHVVHKMRAGDLLLVNNRTWTHAANNWSPEDVRTLYAMYA